MAVESQPGHYDVVILGAGLYGIQAARYYLDIHPEARLCILESEDVVGGTWSEKRIYEAFWTQTPIGMAEFSDRPMTPPPPEDQYYGFFPAKYVTQYLESYVDNHIYNGQTLRDRIKFNVHVQKIEKIADWWMISCHGGFRLGVRKLIDATGLTSAPNVPHLPGQENFQGKILHHKDFGQLGDLKDVKGEHFAVLGGGKSAADVAYAAATAGKNVSWIIRGKGSGPAAFLSAEGRGPYANSNESFYTRFVASFLPNPFSKKSRLSRFLHGTNMGTWLVRKLWESIDKDLKRKVNYQRLEGKENGFENLEPDTSVFWQNDSSGVNQRPGFYSIIAKKVHVYRGEIERVSGLSITLGASKEEEITTSVLPVDVLILCTGWSPVSYLYTADQADQMGLPRHLDISEAEERKSLGESQIKEEQVIFEQYLSLCYLPQYRKVKSSHTPFRLYNAMVPEIDIDSPSQAKIVFLGKLVVGNNFRVAEVQALWAVAYLDGQLRLRKDNARQEIAETVAWCRKRYLSKGELGSWFFFDAVDYTDMLLAQLGLNSHRQKGFLRNFFGPCIAADLRDLREEYGARYPP